MIPSIEIRNYKLFKHFIIDRLTRVNLITGKNNTGKTALLEAIRLFSTQAAPPDIARVFKTRDDETVISEKTVRYLFNYDMLDRKDDKSTSYISIGHKNGHNAIRIAFVGYRERVEKGTIQRYKDDLDAGAKPGLEITRYDASDSFSSIVLPLTPEQWSYGSALWEDESQNKCFYVPSNSLDMKSFLYWWNNILLTPKQNEVIQALRLIEPGLEDIALKSGNGEKSGVFVAKLHGHNAPVPLTSLGEGMLRLLRMAIGIVSAKDDILCIDEFENGLHYSTQAKIWTFMLDIAEKYNVQVFATTHSSDCIDSFQRAINECHNPEIGQVIRLKDRQDGISATLFDAHELSMISSGSLEVR